MEQLYGSYLRDPSSVDAEWREFFEALNDDPAAIEKSANGATWKKPNWPIAAGGDLVSALDGNWAINEKILGDKIKGKAAAKGTELSSADVQRASRDSVRAIMMVRAYRMRGPVSYTHLDVYKRQRSCHDPWRPRR